MVATGFGSAFMTLGGFTLLAIATSVLIINVVFGSANYLRGVLEWGPLVWVGRISYGVYLWHYPIFKTTSFLTSSWPVQLAVALAVTLAVTCFSYYLIERPALSLKRRSAVRQNTPNAINIR